MARPIPWKEVQRAVDAKAKFGSVKKAANELGWPTQTLYNRLKIADREGVKPGAKVVEDAKPVVKDLTAVERENQLLKDKISVLSSKLVASHRTEGLFESLLDEVRRVIVPLEPIPSDPIKLNNKAENRESLVLHISDEHADQIVEPHRVGGCEEYNLGVALARAERLVEKTISISRNTMANYSFPELWILAYGDHVSGEIHDYVNHSAYRNMFDNAIAVGQMHALMIRDLAPYFPKINVLYLSGNHGRRTQKKNFLAPKDNWDYLVARTSEMLCIGIKNVEFLIPDSFSYTFEINGWNFCAFHGDDIKSWNGIPHYGIERKTRRLTAVHSAQGRQIHYFVMGHFHSRSQMEHPIGEVLINGTWKATDEFAYEQLGLITKPSQLLHGVNEKYGISFRFPVFMKFDGDTKGPNRYTAPLKSLSHLAKIGDSIDPLTNIV